MRAFLLFLTSLSAVFSDENYTFFIKNMACISCYETILQTLETTNGVEQVEMNFDKKLANVRVKDGLKSTKIVEILRQKGYDAVLKK